MWKDVERCGKMWKDVERCGKMWKDVESEIHWKWNVFSKVGRCWKSQLENGAIRLHRKIVSSSFLMVKPPRNRWFESQTMQHPFCCFKAFVGKTCCLVKITFWLVKTLFCLVKTTIRLVKTTSCLVKAHGNMAFFPAFQGWNGEPCAGTWDFGKLQRLVRFLSETSWPHWVPCDLVRESSPNGPRVQVKYCNLLMIYWLIND